MGGSDLITPAREFFGITVPRTGKTAVVTVLAATALLALGPPASADPVRIVTAGSVDAHEGEAGTFSLRGPGFLFSGEGVFGAALGQCFPCSPGTVVRLATTAPPHVHGDPPFLDGRLYEGPSIHGGPFLDGTLTFHASPVIAPDIPLNGFSTVTTSFAFAGLLIGFDNFELSGTPLFAADLRGRGLVRVEFSNTAELGLHASRVTYEFQDADPIPEPTTMLLLGWGLGGVGLARRRQRRRHAGT